MPKARLVSTERVRNDILLVRPLPLLLLLLAPLGCDPAGRLPERVTSAQAPSSAGPGAGPDRAPASVDGAAGSTLASSHDGPSADAGSGRISLGGADADRWLVDTLEAADGRWVDWLRSAEQLRLQILVSVAPRKGDRWRTYELRADAEYFYPASAIKPFLAIAALGALRVRAGQDIALGTKIRRCRDDRGGCEPPRVDEDKQDASEAADPAEPASPTKKKHAKLRIGTEITKLLSYSDNDSYNRLYDIVGHRELNEAMAAMGFASVRFHHRMDTPAEGSRKTLRVMLLPPGKRAIDIPRRVSDFVVPATEARGLRIGTAHNADGRLVEEPMSFEQKNYVPLGDLHRLLRALLLPEEAAASRLPLSEPERALLVRAMTARPDAAKSAAEHHPLLPGVLEVLPKDQIRYVGKSGRAYGFHIDNALIENVATHRSMLVTVAVYANPNGVLNDDDYGYDELSKPLLASLGHVLTAALLGGSATDASSTSAPSPSAAAQPSAP